MTVTLTIGAALIILNIWLMLRCVKARASQEVSVGDGGDELVIRRMRAHSNFTESAPLVLILIAALEYAGGSATWLWVLGIAFVIGRIGHGFGMDGGALAKGRMIGTLLSVLTQLCLAGTAVWLVNSKLL